MKQLQKIRFPRFDGSFKSWFEWREKVENQLRLLRAVDLLDRVPKDDEEKEIDGVLYSLFHIACIDGGVCVLIKQHKDERQKTWQALKEWFSDDAALDNVME